MNLVHLNPLPFFANLYDRLITQRASERKQRKKIANETNLNTIIKWTNDLPSNYHSSLEKSGKTAVLKAFVAIEYTHLEMVVALFRKIKGIYILRESEKYLKEEIHKTIDYRLLKIEDKAKLSPTGINGSDVRELKEAAESIGDDGFIDRIRKIGALLEPRAENMSLVKKDALEKLSETH